MVYRAKITKIQAMVDDLLSLNYYNRVKDSFDVYIEVENEEIAEQLELLNETASRLSLQKLRLIDLIDNYNA